MGTVLGVCCLLLAGCRLGGAAAGEKSRWRSQEAGGLKLGNAIYSPHINKNKQLIASRNVDSHQ